MNDAGGDVLWTGGCRRKGGGGGAEQSIHWEHPLPDWGVDRGFKVLVLQRPDLIPPFLQADDECVASCLSGDKSPVCGRTSKGFDVWEGRA